MKKTEAGAGEDVEETGIQIKTCAWMFTAAETWDWPERLSGDERAHTRRPARAGKHRPATRSREARTLPTPWPGLEHTTLGETPDAQGHVACDCVYVECPEQAGPRRQEEGEWAPGAGGGGWGAAAKEDRAHFGGDGMFWNEE